MGSVKDLVILEEPKEGKLGVGRFVFSDRYSVFDYGEMPDPINGKGKALCMLSAYFFERLEEAGIKTHYLGLYDAEQKKLKRFDEVDEAVNVMEIRLVRVIHLEKKNGYDYSSYKSLKGNFLIPVEVIYRNSLPEGSSVFRRLEKGQITLSELGLSRMPEPGERLANPFIDFSTKLESEDRYLNRNEVLDICSISEDELLEICRVATTVDEIITRETEKAGIINEDGKIELAFDESRQLMVVDSVGTPDECRFSYDGIEISKEVLRRHYRKTDWYKRLQILKGEEDWRRILGAPPRLPEELKKAVSDMYMACCNEITGRKVFEVDSLREIIGRIKELV
jgi:phosphoribosylaminoimidazole-succinocarboxamide synthase